jgi:hypothetical protein
MAAESTIFGLGRTAGRVLALQEFPAQKRKVNETYGTNQGSEIAVTSQSGQF